MISAVERTHFVQNYDNHYREIKSHFERTIELIDIILDEIAIEAPFYGKNVQSMLFREEHNRVAMAAGPQEIFLLKLKNKRT